MENETTPHDATERQRLYDELYARLESRAAVAKLLCISSAGLSNVLKGTASDEFTASVTENMRKAVDHPNDFKVSKKRPKVRSMVKSTCPSAGGKSLAGIEHTLGTDTFAALQAKVAPEFMSLVAGQIKVVRGLLNLCIQLQDDTARAKIRAQLTPEVEELFLTIQLFNDKHPTKLTPLLDGQREFWEQMKKGEADE